MKKINVYFDSQIFGMQDYGGISRYFTELIKHFSTKNVVAQLNIKISHNDHIKHMNLGFYDAIFFKNIFRNYIYLFINSLFDIKTLICSKYDLFHPTYYEPYFYPFLRNKPIVVTVYDMVHELYHKNYLHLKKRIIDNKMKIINRADHVISISENTKRDIIRLYGIDPNKITVIYLSNSLQKWDKIDRLKLPEKYILYTGHRWIYKNFELFIKSISKLIIKNDIHIVCAGGNTFTPIELDLFRRLKISDRLFYQKISGDEHDKQLSECYAKALAFAYPSKYEGFGIPILESFANDCPVVLSNTSCFPEIAKDAAVYFNPNNKIDISKSVNKVISSKKLRENLIKKGRMRLKYFSWDKTARETALVYKKVIKNHEQKNHK